MMVFEDALIVVITRGNFNRSARCLAIRYARLPRGVAPLALWRGYP